MAKVLLIEDEKDSRDLIKITLEMEGHTVAEAASGEEGVAMAVSDGPDLILTDISLPGMLDGLEVMRRIRGERRLDEVPVVALTAHAMPGDRERVLGAGFDGYITKPILDLEEFARRVTALAAGARAMLAEPDRH